MIRANLTAWAETVPALEHVLPGGVGFEDVAFTRDGEGIALAVGKDEVQCFRTDTGQPIGPPIGVPVGQGRAMEFAPDGRSLWVASPGDQKVVDRWAIHRFDPVGSRRSSRRSRAPGRSIASPSPRTGGTSSGRSGVAPGGPGRRSGRGSHPQVADGVDRRVGGGDRRDVRTVPVNAEHDYETANAWPDTYLSLSPDGETVTAWVQRGATGSRCPSP